MQGNPTPTPASIGAQPAAATLTTLAGLAPVDGNFIVGNGTTWIAESGSTARDSLALGTAAILNTGTTEGTIPLLGAGGRLDAALLPANSTATLTLANSFTQNSTATSSLRIIPGSRIAILSFSLDRSTTWIGWLSALTWNAAYAAVHDVVIYANTGANQTDVQTMRARVLSGASALELLPLAAAAPFVAISGQIVFEY
jgi:hypothetical protein